MSDQKNSGEPADIENLQDGIYKILVCLTGMEYYRGEFFRDAYGIYPRLFIVNNNGPLFVSIKAEEVIGTGILLSKLKSLDCLTIEKGKIIKVS